MDKHKVTKIEKYQKLSNESLRNSICSAVLIFIGIALLTLTKINRETYTDAQKLIFNLMEPLSITGGTAMLIDSLIKKNKYDNKIEELQNDEEIPKLK